MPKRQFLDWVQPCLSLAAHRLIDEFAQGETELDLSARIVVLPGARAARRLLEILVALAEKRALPLQPPRFITSGNLLELFVAPKARRATLTEQRIAWVRALRESVPEEISSFVRSTPHHEDLNGWSALAQKLSELHTEVTAGGLSFAEVASHADSIGFSDSERWGVLAQIQQQYITILHQASREDPYWSGLDALKKGNIRAVNGLVMVGVSDLNPLLKDLFKAGANDSSIFVYAPERYAACFDELGCIDVKAWHEKLPEIRDEQLLIADTPQQLEHLLVREISRLPSATMAQEITIGVTDAGLASGIVRALGDKGVEAHRSSGEAIALTPPLLLLRAIAEYLQSRSFAAFSALVRHPDVERWLRSDEGNAIPSDLLSLIDRFQREHLPARADRPLPGSDATAIATRRVVQEVERLLSDFSKEAKSLAQWCQNLVQILVTIYGDRALHREKPHDARQISIADALQATLNEFAALPEALSLPLKGSHALRLILERLSTQTLAEEPSENGVELLGWLELALDDAPILFVAGMNEGLVPESVNSDAFLPNSMRSRLGLLDNERRFARDSYALQSMLHWRKKISLIALRRGCDESPLLLSRLVLHGASDSIAARVLKFYGDHAEERSTPINPARHDRLTIPPPPQKLTDDELPNTLSVTCFKDYLLCPYRFYLQHIAKVTPCEDESSELEAQSFGALAHHVLHLFGQSEVAACSDRAVIENFLVDTLDGVARERFGTNVQAAARLQVLQLQERLREFAEWQASWVSKGWRIKHVELDLSGPATEILQGTKKVRLRGRIDRVDYHEGENKFAIFDYKTSESAIDARKAHRRRSGAWKDLQLPLYQKIFAASVAEESSITTGYFSLPRTRADTGTSWADWSGEDLDAAWTTMNDIVACVLAQEFWPPQQVPGSLDHYAVLCGNQRIRSEE